MSKEPSVLEVRMATPNDAAEVLKIYSHYVRETAITFEYEPPSEEEMRRRISTTLEKYPWLVCVSDGTCAGYAYAGAHRQREAYQWGVETSVYVCHSHHRMGVARALYSRLLGMLKLQGYTQALAGIALPNEASVKFHERLGFEPIGVYPKIGFKFGRWHDTMWSRLELNPSGSEHEPPRTPAELSGTSAWEEAKL